MRIQAPLLFTGFALALTAVSASQQKKPTSRAAQSRPMGWTGVLDETEFAALHELKKGEKPKLHGESIKIGSTNAYLSLPKSEKPSAAVLVIHEWWGLNDNIKHWTDRLAADGYAALAIDLYEGTVATTRDGALAAMQAVDAEKAIATLRSAHRFLKNSPRVAAKKRACIGWCFGGGWSLRLAMAAPDLDAAVVYYGRLVTDPEQLGPIRAPVLGVFGNKDRGIPKKSVDAFEKAMTQAGKELVVRRYDANHAFANPSSARYAATHAASAWKETRAFLRKHLAPSLTGSFDAGGNKLMFVAPSGWTDAGARVMRQVNLDAGKGVECYVTVLRGNGGGLAPNLNRWRGQLGHEPLSMAAIEKLPRIDAVGKKVPLLSVDGSYRGMGGKKIENARLLGTMCQVDGAAVFVKMLGPRKAVAAQEKAFREFCASLRKK